MILAPQTDLGASSDAKSNGAIKNATKTVNKQQPTEQAAEETTLTVVKRWFNNSTVSRSEVDCIIAVMMKILDDKCKMPGHEKQIMETLYRLTLPRHGHHFGADYHSFISNYLNRDRQTLTPHDTAVIYEKRVLAETQISRPVMKRFKARLRQESVLPTKSTRTKHD